MKLAWTVSSGTPSYILERKTLGGQFAALGKDPIPEAQFSDSTIAPLATYVYRVRLLESGKASATASKEITVGPPPVGFSVIVPTPSELPEGEGQRAFGMYPQMVFDSNGDPAVAYYFNVRKGDDESDSALYFASWNRSEYKWNAPVLVGKVGVIGRPFPISFARDAATNVYGIVSETTLNHSLPLSLSTDNGVTWQTKPAVTFGEETAATCPTLALAGGTAFLAFAQSNSPLQFATGSESSDPASWKKSPVPNAVEGTPNTASLSLAVDSAGKPGLGYAIGPAEGYNVTIAYWRVGGKAVKVMDSKNFQNDDPHVLLTFSGTKPSLFVYLGRTEARFEKNELNWFATSTDEGSTWSEPAYLPNDGKFSMSGTGLAVGSKGQGAVFLDVTGGSGDDKCGQPKLARSTDLAHWSTCSPAGGGKPRFSGAYAGKLAFAENGKLYGVVANPSQQTSNDGPAPQGLVLWREP